MIFKVDIKFYATKLVEVLHYAIGYRTVKWNNEKVTVSGPPKIYTIFLITALAISNIYTFIPKFIKNFNATVSLSTKLSTILHCTRIFSAIISLILQELTSFQTNMKFHSNLNQLKLNYIFEYEKKIIENTKSIYCVYFLLNVQQFLHHMRKYHVLDVIIPMSISNFVMDAFIMNFFINILLLKFCVENINSKLSKALELDKINVDYRSTSVRRSHLKNQENTFGCYGADMIVSLLNIYEKLNENIKISSKTVKPMVNLNIFMGKCSEINNKSIMLFQFFFLSLINILSHVSIAGSITWMHKIYSVKSYIENIYGKFQMCFIKR